MKNKNVQFRLNKVRQSKSRLNTKGKFILTKGVAGVIFHKEEVIPKQSTNYIHIERNYHRRWMKLKDKVN